MQQMSDGLVYLAGTALIFWGAAHIVVTRRIANSFGEISTGNRRILIMEWAAEGITHISLGTLVILTAALESSSDPAADLVYRVVAAVLVILATLTSLTGARTPAIPFKICPFVLTGAAALLLAASLL